jgi:hypothetical protein
VDQRAGLVHQLSSSHEKIYITKDGMVPGLRNRLLRVAAFQNPEFYKAQAMRLPTYDKPRIIGCTGLTPCVRSGIIPP